MTSQSASAAPYPGGNPAPSDWASRYGPKHRWQRIKDFPIGIEPLQKVRICKRNQHYLLNWWESGARKNRSLRIDGDLLEAMTRARDIDQRLVHYRRSGCPGRRVNHPQLVEAYLENLGKRAEADELAPATYSRYRGALSHYLAYTAQAEVDHRYRYAAQVDLSFQQGFAAFLHNRQVSPNGHPNTTPRPLTDAGIRFIQDTSRAMFQWASDPQGGNLLPDGFINPFLRKGKRTRSVTLDPLRPMDITVEMAADLLQACHGAGDRYAMSLFASILLMSMRASEPRMLFRENIVNGWMAIGELKQIDYKPKGLQDKQIPVLPELAALLRIDLTHPGQGLLFHRRRVIEGMESPPLFGASLDQIATTYRDRCRGITKVAERQKIRDRVIHDAGGLNYDHIQREFRRWAKQLGWPARATLKDLRHLAITSFNNSNMKESYRRYLAGMTQEGGAILNYTHLDKVRCKYIQAVEDELGPVMRVLREGQGMAYCSAA